MKNNWEFSEDLEDRRTNLVTTGYDNYCLQTLGGKEIELAQELNIIYRDYGAMALPFLRLTHKSEKGVRTTYQKVILPGYVFLFLPTGTLPSDIRPGGVGFHYVKNVDKKDLLLHGDDKKYAQWVFHNGGIIGMSKG